VEGVEPDERLVDPDSRHRPRIQIAPFAANFHSTRMLLPDSDAPRPRHLDDPGAALRPRFFFTQPTGALLLTVPAFQVSGPTTTSSINTVYGYRRRHCVHCSAGWLRNLEERYWYSGLVGQVAIRLVGRVFRRPPSGCPRASGLDHRLFYWISRMEQQTLRDGTHSGVALCLLRETGSALTLMRRFLIFLFV